ncbi:uncharacterized protein LOC115260333 [Aedes albopictus]|uniref:Uncharacterized protein n=1 Tax=Aedes albopictus TaxID=7160 RepID=A0ABM1YDS9_AEDAL|nr:uncharacterized protein LOC115260333 [Aedes albopictus]
MLINKFHFGKRSPDLSVPDHCFGNSKRFPLPQIQYFAGHSTSTYNDDNRLRIRLPRSSTDPPRCGSLSNSNQRRPTVPMKSPPKTPTEGNGFRDRFWTEYLSRELSRQLKRSRSIFLSTYGPRLTRAESTSPKYTTLTKKLQIASNGSREVDSPITTFLLG